MADLKYEIKRKYGILGEGANGWKKELNYVSWNERTPKLDIRDWEPGYKRMGRGITLTKPEAMQLKNILQDINFDNLGNDDSITLNPNL